MRHFCILLTVLLSASSIFAGTGEVWIDTLDGTMGLDDFAKGLTIDPISGAIYLYGETNGHVFIDSSISPCAFFARCSPDGDTLWTRVSGSAWGANSLITDGNGDVYVAARPRSDTVDYLVFKYSASGDSIWSTVYNHTTLSSDEIGGIALDQSYNVYLLGDLEDVTDDEDIALVKILPNGEVAWAAVLPGPVEDDEPEDLAVDVAGNIIVASTSHGLGGSYDIWTIKFNPQGDTLWTVRYIDPVTCGARRIATDLAGNIYVAGTCGDYGSTDVILIKYNSSGAFQWDWRYNGPANLDDNFADMQVNADGSIWVAFFADQDIMGWTQPYRLATARLDSGGNQVWMTSFSAPERPWSICSQSSARLAVGSDESVVVGYSPCWPHTLKYSADGDLLAWWPLQTWPAGTDSAGHGSFGDIALDGNGNIYGAGNLENIAGGEWYFDIIVYKYAPGCCLIRGDATGDSNVNIADITYLINRTFRNGPPPPCRAEADPTADGNVNVADLTYLIAYLFRGGPAPAPCG